MGVVPWDAWGRAYAKRKRETIEASIRRSQLENKRRQQKERLNRLRKLPPLHKHARSSASSSPSKASLSPSSPAKARLPASSSPSNTSVSKSYSVFTSKAARSVAPQDATSRSDAAISQVERTAPIHSTTGSNDRELLRSRSEPVVRKLNETLSLAQTITKESRIFGVDQCGGLASDAVEWRGPPVVWGESLAGENLSRKAVCSTGTRTHNDNGQKPAEVRAGRRKAMESIDMPGNAKKGSSNGLWNPLDRYWAAIKPATMRREGSMLGTQIQRDGKKRKRSSEALKGSVTNGLRGSNGQFSRTKERSQSARNVMQASAFAPTSTTVSAFTHASSGALSPASFVTLPAVNTSAGIRRNASCGTGSTRIQLFRPMPATPSRPQFVRPELGGAPTSIVAAPPQREGSMNALKCVTVSSSRTKAGAIREGIHPNRRNEQNVDQIHSKRGTVFRLGMTGLRQQRPDRSDDRPLDIEAYGRNMTRKAGALGSQKGHGSGSSNIRNGRFPRALMGRNNGHSTQPYRQRAHTMPAVRVPCVGLPVHAPGASSSASTFLTSKDRTEQSLKSNSTASSSTLPGYAVMASLSPTPHFPSTTQGPSSGDPDTVKSSAPSLFRYGTNECMGTEGRHTEKVVINQAGLRTVSGGPSSDCGLTTVDGALRTRSMDRAKPKALPVAMQIHTVQL